MNADATMVHNIKDNSGKCVKHHNLNITIMQNPTCKILHDCDLYGKLANLHDIA